MKWIFFMTSVAFTGFLTACSFESFDPVPGNSSIISTVNIKEMTISFYDIEKDKKLPDWSVDRPYIGGLILPDQDTFLLYGKGVSSADLYSLSKGKKVASWDTGEGIVNALLVRDGTEIAFADQDRDSIRFFDLKGNETDEVKTEKEPLTLLEAEEKLYVISFHQEKLGIIDLAGKQVLPGFEIHPAAAGAILCKEENELWIGGHGEGSAVEELIHIYDLDNGKLKKEISAPVMPVNFTKNQEHIFVLSHGSNTLYKLAEDGTKMDSLKVGANPFEIEFFAEKIIVAGYDSNDLIIIDPQSLEIEKKLQVGKGPFQIVTREGKQDESR
ncbi:DUF4221 family protein [Mesobacillus subterraneus]|uniref:WD40 repeat domain-containing protein n=1 Tax=Mesobacillus subterraneus TaxID=285983 RepID=A0A3R9FH18_9BACI|nr:DUF4221 family protein [Mesobacillus subterraneus]RSD26237.1 WD40 repeat domain-containing protein [Mesobacillus subterraneus]